MFPNTPAPAARCLRIACLLLWGGVSLLIEAPTASALSEIGEIDAKFVFIAFPDRPDSLSGSALENQVEDLVTGAHVVATDSIMSYVQQISLGALAFGSATEILLPCEESVENLPAATWLADLSAAGYRDIDDLPSSYHAEWDDVTGAWWTTQKISVLHSEILWKIWNDHLVHDRLDELADVDRLFLIYLTLDSPLADPNESSPGGMTTIRGLPPADDPAHGFYETIDASMSLHVVMNTKDYAQSAALLPWRTAAGVLHEFGHTQGFPDGPPSIDDDYPRYYYGHLNLMSQHIRANRGIPVWGLHCLAQSGWIEVVDFTGENLIGEVVPDIRRPGPLAGGRIYRFRDFNSAGDEQEFLFAFHCGQGLDSQASADLTGAMIPSQGLEVFHAKVNGIPVVDIESAFGRFQTQQASLPDTLEHWPYLGWGTADAAEGYDNYDPWPGRDVEDFSEYGGDLFDFFRTDLRCLEGEAFCWNRSEFSFRTNPSARLYAPGPDTGHWYRYNPQVEDNSLVVRIRDQHNDDDNPLGFPHMVVDFLSAPYATLTRPPAGDYQGAQTVRVEWDTTFVDVIDRVDIDYSRFGGTSWYRLASDIPAGTSWTCQLDTTMTGDECRFRVIYHNSLSEHTGSAELPWTFRVLGGPYPAEDLLEPGAGSSAYTGVETDVVWTDHFWQHPVDSLRTAAITLEVLEPTPRQVSIDLAEVVHDPEGGTCRTVWRPANEDISPATRIGLTFETATGAIAQSAPSFPFAVYPLGVVYHDYTDDVVAVGEWYTGTPYSVVARDITNTQNDSLPDLVVTTDGGDHPDDLSRSQVYRARPAIGGAGVDLIRLRGDNFPIEFPSGRGLGSVSGDFDNDGGEDLFIADQAYPQLFVATGQTFDDIAADGLFANQQMLPETVCGAWVDIDHDGDLDLYCGRAGGDVTSYEGPGGGKAVATPDVLWRNDGAGTPRFVDATEAFGLDEAGDAATAACAWADADGDGLWEFVRGDLQGTATALFRENEAGQFTVDASFSVDGPVNSVLWCDLDGQYGLDLVVGRTEMAPAVYLHDGSTAWIQVSQSELPALPGSFVSTQITSLDSNEDGRRDLMIGSYWSGANPQLWMNLNGQAQFGSRFHAVDDGVTFSLDNGRYARGLAAADFDGDGDHDVVLGRPSADTPTGRYYAALEQDERLTNHWVGVNLVDPDSPHRSPIGARVEVRNWNTLDLLGVAQVDGGSGRGSQQPRRLHFGLGTQEQDLRVEVRWASGRPQVRRILGTDLDRYHTIAQGDSVEISEPSITVSFDFDPATGSMDWRFEWETDNWTDAGCDAVSIERVRGSSCGFESMVLDAGDPDVDLQCVRDDPQTGTYRHTLVWRARTCYLGCSYRFSVSSKIHESKQAVTSEDHTFSFFACPSGS